MNDPRLEQAARVCYETHHEGMDDLAWHEMLDWQKERWRRAAQAVIDLVTSSRPPIRDTGDGTASLPLRDGCIAELDITDITPRHPLIRTA